MTVNSEDTPRVQYTANSITTIFPITFVYDDISDVHVYFISNSTGLATAWTKDASGPTGYTVSAGAIVANTAPSNGYLVAVCTTPITQLVDVKPNRALTADTLEGVFDKLTLIGRDLKGSVSRALIYGPTYTGSIPYAEDLADEIKQDSVDASVAAVNALTFATSLHIDNLASLRLFPGGETTSIYLDCRTTNGDGGQGTFVWSTADLSSEVTSDPLHGIYVAPTSDPTGASGAWVRQLNGYVTPKMFGAVGDGVVDDSVAFQAALSAYKTVYVTNGTYLINGPYTSASGMEMQDGQMIIAESKDAVLLQGTIRFMLTAGTGDGGTSNPADNKKNIVIRGLTLRNDAGTFLAQKHLMVLSAVSDVLVENCRFIGPQGDAIYIGQGTTGTAERHNENVTIRGCIFDGVNNQNRNGVSIIDGDGVLIDDCSFVNMSSDTMPGPVDFEPNNATHNAVGHGIAVQNCRFFNCKGAGAFVYYTPGFVMPVPPSCVKFVGNYVDPSCVFTSAVLLKLGEVITDDSPLMGFSIEDNVFNGCTGSTVNVKGVRGIAIIGNTFEDTIGPLVIGANDDTVKGLVYDVDFSHNKLRNSGNNSGMLLIGMTKRLNITENLFSKPRTSPYAITFLGAGVTTQSSDVAIERNVFVKGATQTHTVYAAGHTFDPDSNRYFSNGADASLLNKFTYGRTAVAYDQLCPEFDASTVLAILPDSLPLGQSSNIVNGDTSAPDAHKQGMVVSNKYSENTNYRKFIVQVYYPANTSAVVLKDMYWRKGDPTTNAWSAWVKVTGI